MKRLSTAQPFIDHDAQGILIAGRAGMSLELFRCHVGDGPGCLLDLLGARTLGDDSQAEITQ